jgi:branched-chain amino acid transport system ATP-binding protein
VIAAGEARGRESSTGSAHAAAQPILSVRGLRRRFGGIVAADNVNIEIQSREIVGLIGPNGSGKSTLFNLVSGTIKPDGGEIRFDGSNIAGLKAHRIARRGLARTFQIPALFENMTVLENLLAAAAEGQWDGAHPRAESAMRLLSLEPVRDNRAVDLSGGQQKLLEFGRIIMRRASLMLLDEVTAGVHPKIRKIMLDAIVKLREDGATFFLIEHDMELVRNVCDRIIVMDAGQVITTGTFDEIARDSQVMQAYLGRHA